MSALRGEAKYCKACEEEKPLSEFHLDRNSKDGTRGSCKRCVLDRQKVERGRDPEKYRTKAREESRRRRAEDPERYREYLRTWRARHPEKERERLARNRKEQAKKVSARRRVAKAIERGSIVRPDVCERCDRLDPLVQAHHADYDRPMEVEWLCSYCHAAEHQKEASK
jgi:hypothetical protein